MDIASIVILITESRNAIDVDHKVVTIYNSGYYDTQHRYRGDRMAPVVLFFGFMDECMLGNLMERW